MPGPQTSTRPAPCWRPTTMSGIIAGGQTLVPLMAMRLARPKRLIDIARISELAFVREEGDAVAIGATTRQCVLEHDPVVARRGCRCSPRSCPSSAMRRPGRAAPSAARSPMPIRRRRSRWSRSRSARRCLIGKAPQTARYPGLRILHRSDDDGAAGGRLSHRGALPGLARRRASAPASTRSARARATSRSRPRRRRSRWTRTASAVGSPLGIGAITPSPMRLDAVGKALDGTRLEDGARARGRRRRARGTSSRCPICTRPPPIAGASR